MSPAVSTLLQTCCQKEKFTEQAHKKKKKVNNEQSLSPKNCSSCDNMRDHAEEKQRQKQVFSDKILH